MDCIAIMTPLILLFGKVLPHDLTIEKAIKQVKRLRNELYEKMHSK